MDENVTKTNIKTIAISIEVHEKFMALKKTLKIGSANELINKLVTEYEEIRK